MKTPRHQKPPEPAVTEAVPAVETKPTDSVHPPVTQFPPHLKLVSFKGFQFRAQIRQDAVAIATASLADCTASVGDSIMVCDEETRLVKSVKIESEFTVLGF